MTWPPEIAELKTRMGIAPDDTRKDAQLTQDLNAAVSFVQRVRKQFRYDLTDPTQLELPSPTDDLRLGTLMLAARWQLRTRSPDGMIDMGELGSGRVSSFDLDIDRLLGIGKFMKATFA